MLYPERLRWLAPSEDWEFLRDEAGDYAGIGVGDASLPPAQALALDSGEAPEELHITLGMYDHPLADVERIVRAVAPRFAPFSPLGSLSSVRMT